MVVPWIDNQPENGPVGKLIAAHEFCLWLHSPNTPVCIDFPSVILEEKQRNFYFNGLCSIQAVPAIQALSALSALSQDPTLTCGACRNPLIRLTFR